MKNRIKGLKLLKILISFILIIVIIPGVLADEVTVSIGKIAADSEGRCTAPVVLSSITDYGTGSITLKYDPSIVHVSDVTGSEDSIVTSILQQLHSGHPTKAAPHRSQLQWMN
jgi:hypothetical protein